MRGRAVTAARGLKRPEMPGEQILTLSCKDRPGITARVTTFLFEQGGNIIEAQQFGDLEDGDFFMRVALDPGGADTEVLRSAFGQIAAEDGMRWNLRSRDRAPQVLILVSKFDDHLPLYRQAQILERQGVMIERSTLSFWMGYAAAEVAPVVARLREMMLASTRLFADETVVPVLDPGRGRERRFHRNGGH